MQQDRFALVYFSWTERTEESPSQRGPDFSFSIEPHHWVTFELIEGRRVWVLKYPAARQQLFFWCEICGIVVPHKKLHCAVVYRLSHMRDGCGRAQEPDSGQDRHIASTITEYLSLNAAEEDEPSAGRTRVLLSTLKLATLPDVHHDMLDTRIRSCRHRFRGGQGNRGA